MKNCMICDHAHREDIERALFNMSPENSSLTLEKISEEFEVPVSDLQRHSLFHSPYGAIEGSDSIVRRMKLREMDLLGEASREYYDTMKMVGNRIRKFAKNSDCDEDSMFERRVTKSIVDLYLGCGENLQKTTRTIADIDHMLNGPKDDGLSGLTALAQALQGSAPTSQSCKDADPE